MSDIESALFLTVCVALLIWGGGWKYAIVSIAYLIFFSLVYHVSIYFWCENGKYVALAIVCIIALAQHFGAKIMALIKRVRVQ